MHPFVCQRLTSSLLSSAPAACECLSSADKDVFPPKEFWNRCTKTPTVLEITLTFFKGHFEIFKFIALFHINKSQLSFYVVFYQTYKITAFIFRNVWFWILFVGKLETALSCSLLCKGAVTFWWNLLTRKCKISIVIA